jgi:hypothetical protein
MQMQYLLQLDRWKTTVDGSNAAHHSTGNKAASQKAGVIALKSLHTPTTAQIINSLAGADYPA